jgi:hypothetical protein
MMPRRLVWRVPKLEIVRRAAPADLRRIDAMIQKWMMMVSAAAKHSNQTSRWKKGLQCKYLSPLPQMADECMFLFRV